MVVLNRIAYLRGLAQFGAKFIFSVSVNPETGVQKIKVVIDPSFTIPLDQQFCTLSMLEFLTQLCFSHKVADKGHKHTSGISEVIFFITAPSSSAAPPSSMVHAATDDSVVGVPHVKRIRFLDDHVPAVCAHVPLDSHADIGTLDDFLADIEPPNTLEESNDMDEPDADITDTNNYMAEAQQLGDTQDDENPDTFQANFKGLIADSFKASVKVVMAPLLEQITNLKATIGDQARMIDDLQARVDQARILTDGTSTSSEVRKKCDDK